MENKDFWKFRELYNKEIKEVLDNRELEYMEIIWNLDYYRFYLHIDYKKLKEFFSLRK